VSKAHPVELTATNDRLFSYQHRQYLWAALFVAPAIVLLVVFFIAPIIQAFQLSLMDGNLFRGDLEYVGLSNYQSVLEDEIFWISLRNTLLFILGTTPFSMFLALVLAEMVEKLRPRFRDIYRFFMFLPVVASLSVTGVLWTFMLNPTVGYVNQVLRVAGINGPAWLNDPNWALTSIVLITIWKSVGVYFVIYVAGMTGINTSILEAAAIDGANRVQRFRHIIVPLLRPIHIFLFFLGVISSFQNFGLIHVMTQGGPNNSTNILVYQIWQEAFRFFDFGRATAISLIVFFPLLLVTIVQIRVTSREES
jgi:multiple sugar transport system permease protein